MDTTLISLSLPIIIPLIGVAYALYNIHWVLSRDPGDDRLIELSNLIANGAETFLKREYSMILPTGLILIAIIGSVYYVIFKSLLVSMLSMLSFALGSLGSGLAGYVGMYVTTRSASRTATAARRGLGDALKVSFRAGCVMGIMLASLALLTISLLYIAYSSLTRDWGVALAPIALGASLMSLFIRVAGGIYTKAADWGADMVGKVESNIPEDDPRNPGVIADNVGDNVGDVAGMASDVYESFIVVLTGSLILFSVFNMPKSLALMILSGASLVLLATLLGIQVVRGEVRGRDAALASMRKLNNSLVLTIIIGSILVVTYSFTSGLVKFTEALALSISMIMGFITAMAVLYVTQYFTHYTYYPVRNIAEQARFSASNVIVTGYSYGLLSAAPIITIVAVALGVSFYLGYSYIPAPIPIEGGVMGTAFASIGLLSLAGIVISLDSYGPVSDNANGLVEMSGLGDEIRRVTDTLDAIGNTYKAITKGYAIASAGLASLVLFIGFIYEALSYSNSNASLPETLSYLSIVNPMLIIGVLIGAVLVYVFSSRLLIAVGKAASELVEEIRRQFRTRRILEGLDKPDYNRAIDIVTRHALREFMTPALLAVVIPVVTGLILGWVALAGLILGTIIVGFPRALLMANAGGAWDNAKKFIEIMADPELGGKGGVAHKNAVIGDVVGDPFKDTAGPSLNPLIKVVNTVSIVFAPLIAMVSLFNPVTHLSYIILTML